MTESLSGVRARFRGGRPLLTSHPWRRGLVLALLLAPVCWFIPQRAPAAVDEPIKVLLAEAQRLEKRGEWGEAADKYEKVLQLDRTQAEVRSKFQHCLRRYFQGVRLRDA